MKPKIKKLWVDALRSGEYKQGTASLKQQTEGITRFCCLGVLCELVHKEAEVKISSECAFHGLRIFTFGGTTSYLPQAVVDYAGLDSPDPMVDCADSTNNSWPLSKLNDDDEGYSFNEIADLIEAQL